MPQKFVDDVVAPAIVDTTILAKCMQNPVNVDEIERDIRGMNLDAGQINVRRRVEELERSGHLQREGNNIRCTDDGKEDVQKVLPWFRTLTERVGAMAPGGRGGR